MSQGTQVCKGINPSSADITKEWKWYLFWWYETFPLIWIIGLIFLIHLFYNNRVFAKSKKTWKLTPLVFQQWILFFLSFVTKWITSLKLWNLLNFFFFFFAINVICKTGLVKNVHMFWLCIELTVEQNFWFLIHTILRKWRHISHKCGKERNESHVSINVYVSHSWVSVNFLFYFMSLGMFTLLSFLFPLCSSSLINFTVFN